jgi:hypothetical protein
MENNMKLSSPWITFVNEIKALFEEDEEIKITYDQNSNELKLFVDNTDKADAISKLLPAEKEFGNVTLKIEVVPPNSEEDSKEKIFARAFANNPALSFIKTGETIFGKISYVVFEKRVIQFYNDQMDDIHGLKSTLYQDIAKDVFGPVDRIYFCTDNCEPDDVKVVKRLGDWQ